MWRGLLCASRLPIPQLLAEEPRYMQAIAIMAKNLVVVAAASQFKSEFLLEQDSQLPELLVIQNPFLVLFDRRRN